MSPKWMNAHGMRRKPFWAGTAVSTTHCSAGCVMGDLIAEWIVFAAALPIAGFALPVEYPLDCVLALSWGILFQYFVIAPTRHLAVGEGLRLAAKADFRALSAFEIGLFGRMTIMQLVLFPSPHLPADRLIRHGIKEVM